MEDMRAPGGGGTTIVRQNLNPKLSTAHWPLTTDVLQNKANNPLLFQQLTNFALFKKALFGAGRRAPKLTFVRNRDGNNGYSTVTDLARFLGWSTSQPRRTAMW